MSQNSARLTVGNFTISLDGYGAGPDQSLENPLGIGGEELHTWMFATRAGLAMQGMEGGEEGMDSDFVAATFAGIGATIMGRNMFGPIRGPWPDEQWSGWWGETPPYHHPVFVLTHHPRPPVRMAGGTTFHFVTEGIEVALEQALAAADGADVSLAGGAGTIQQYLRAGLVDELHIVISRVLLGGGERLFGDGLVGLDGYACTELFSSERVVHARITRTQP